MTYPSQIDPAILARLQQMYAGFQPGFNQTPYLSQDGIGYQVRYGEPIGMGEGQQLQMGPITGYTVGNYNDQTGSPMEIYDTSGRDTGQSEFWKRDTNNYDTLAMLAALGLTGANLLAAGGLGAGAAGATGADAAAGGVTGLGDAGTMYAGTDAAAAGSLGGGASLAGGAATAAGAATGGGLLSSVLPSASTVGSILGPAATVLGAVAGAQGNERSQKQTTEPWAPMQPLLKDKLFPAVGNLLDYQMAYLPEQGKQISQQGLGLLQMPMAQNGFAQFQQRPRFGTGGF